MKTGFTCGAFDLLHAGHVLMLEESRRNCDYLIVGLHTDPSIDRESKNQPIQTLHERLIQLRAIRHVDAVCVYDTESQLLELLKALRPDVRFIGEDHKGKPFTGDDLDIDIFWNSRTHSFSSSELRSRISKAQEHAKQEAISTLRNSREF